MFNTIFKEISTKSTLSNIKILLNIKYDFKIYCVCINRHNTINKDINILYLIEKSTLFLNYTDIEIHLNPFIELDGLNYNSIIDYAISQYLQITGKSEINIKADNILIQKSLINNGFVLNDNSIYKNMYGYKYKKEKDMVV